MTALDQILRWDVVLLLPLCAGAVLYALDARRRFASPLAAPSARLGVRQRSPDSPAVLVDSLPNAVIVFDGQGRILSANSATMRLLDLTQRELLGRDLALLVAQDDVVAHLIARCRAGPSDPSMEAALHRRDGSMVPVHIAVAAVAGETDKFVAVVTDLTQIRREEQAKDAFVSIVSHELRTPLTAIQGALSLLRAQAATQLPEKMRALIEIAHGNTERLLRIINDILDMEKIKAGRMEYVFRQVVLAPLLEEAVVSNQAYAEQFDVSIALGPVPPVAVVADGGRLTQAITNLLSNGIKASRREGCVVLDTRVGADSVRISVTDKGAGIPPAMRERIYDDFFQFDSSAGQKPCGSGLGLGITRSIVRDHGGRIDFVSEVGNGTTFFIDLPLAPVEDQAEEDSSDVSGSASATGG